MDCYCDYDPADVYFADVRRSRKDRKCYECGGPIIKGERYEHVFGKWEGETQAFDTCTRCLDIRQYVKNSVPCFCWAHGNMLEEAADTIQHAYYRAGDEIKGTFMAYGRLVIKAKRFKHQWNGLQNKTKLSQPSMTG